MSAQYIMPSTTVTRSQLSISGDDNKVQAQVYYLKQDKKWEHEKPFYSNIPFDHPDSKQTNLDSVPYNVTLTDIRGHEGDFKLETHGFEVLPIDLEMNKIYDNFSDPYWIQQNYYPRLDSWLKTFLGPDDVERIYVYDHTVLTLEVPQHVRTELVA